jgi:hypothetical protein
MRSYITLIASVSSGALIACSGNSSGLPDPQPDAGTTNVACGPSGGAVGSLRAGGLMAWPEDGGVGPTLATNPGFELDANGWNMSPAFARDATMGHGGSASMRMQNANLQSGIATASQTITLKPGVYKLSGWVKTQALGANANNTGVRFDVDFRPSVNEWQPTETVRGTMEWTYLERPNIVVPENRTARVVLEAYGHPDGTAWFDDVMLVEQLPAALDVYMLYPNYRGMMFEDQPGTIRLDVAVVPPGADFASYKVVASLIDEDTSAVVTSKEVAAADRVLVELDGCGMTTTGSYLVHVALVSTGGGAPVWEAPAHRVTRVPAEARAQMSISFDDHQRILLKGTPRFVLGVYDAGLGYGATDAFWEDLLWSPTGARRMHGLPINIYLNYWYGGAGLEAMTALMDNLHKHGVTYLQTGNCVTRFATGADFQINASDAYVQAFGTHAASAGYYTADECDSNLSKGVFEQYQRLKALDPDSMTFGSLLATNELYMWRDAVDVLSTDPYPMYAAEPANGYNHADVAEWTIDTREVVNDARPFITVLQFFKFTSQGRWPTRTELRNHAYMAIVEGARGLFWWSLGANALAYTCADSATWCPERVQHMDDLRAVMTEIAGLEPALLADANPAALVAVSRPEIRTRIMTVGSARYLFAYNHERTPQQATFTLAAGASSVTVVGEDRTVVPSGTTFGDAFGPFAAHVYKIEGAPAL